MPSIQSKSVVYVTRDLERALGLPLNTKGYFIISNYSAFAKQLVGDKKNVLLVKNKEVLDTRELLENDQVIRFIKKVNNPQILVFKNTVQIEKICNDHGWKLLNPSAKLASTVEEKIAGTKWLGELAKFLPPHQIILGKDLIWSGEEYIIQFNRAHTGSGTILIKSEQEVQEIKTKFPEREVRVTKYIQGTSWTNNNVVWGEQVLCGNISFQITGMEPFTKLPFATVGNDWSLVKILTVKQKEEYVEMATAIGKKLASEGWKGEFGIDVILEHGTGKLYLIEINARQPASTSCESWLQRESRKNPKELTVFEAHLLALFGEQYQKQKLVLIKSGAQITQKIVSERKNEPKSFLKNIKKMQTKGWQVFVHDNAESEKDWIRMQTKESVMENDVGLNGFGYTAMFVALHAIWGREWSFKRAGAIVAKNGNILLIKRHRFGFEYYTIPGGNVEVGESLKTTAKRELMEESGLQIKLSAQKPLEVFSAGREEYYFFADSFVGEARLGGEEKEFSTKNNFYQLEWMPIKNLKKINLLPEELKSKLLKVLK